MKYLLSSLAFVAGSAMACPADAPAKDALAPAATKPVVAAAKAVPTAKPAAVKVNAHVTDKQPAETRKTASL